MKNKFSLIGCALIIAAALALVPLTAQATPYTWTGTTSNVWALSTNWTGGTFPNAYTDQATITAGTNKPVILTGTELLGIASGTALTTSGTSALSPLDIQGTLGIQGNIVNTRSSGAGTEKITIEGTLRNDAASNATTYSITGASGSIALVGGTISSSNGGLWSFGQTVGGYGTIASQFTTTSVVTANVAGQTLHITYPNLSISASSVSSSVANAILSLEGTNLTAGTLSHTGVVDLNGVTMTGVSIGNTTGAVNLTGDVTLVNNGNSVGSNGAFNFNGHTLNMTGATPGFSAISAITIGTGILNNATAATALLSQGPYNLAGGSITSTGGGSIQGGGIYGWGTISAPITPTGSSAIVEASGSGHTLLITGPVNLSNGNLVSSSGATLDLRSTISTPTAAGYINPGAGTVNLYGANLVGTQTINLRAGAVNVTGDSTMSGPINSDAALTVNNNINLNASGATFTNTNLGVVYVTGGATATWGNFTNNGVYKSDPSTQTFTNLTVGTGGTIQAQSGDVYQIKGDFINNSTQNTSWNTSAATLAFLTGTSSAHNVALAGADLGQVLAGYTNNFAWGTLDLTGQTLALSDGNATPGAALYLGKITGETIVAGMVTDITGNGFNIYYNPSLNPDLLGLTYGLGSGGSLEPFSAAAVPIPPSVLLLGSGLLGLLGLGWRRKRLSQA